MADQEQINILKKSPLFALTLGSKELAHSNFWEWLINLEIDGKHPYVELFIEDFDEKVFNFNCDWYKCNNPFDNIPVSDIRGFAHHFLVDDSYKTFCEANNYFSETGNYSTTAEAVYRYISENTDFIEAHTALRDAEIEAEILLHCVDSGANLNEDYKAFRTIDRPIEKTLHVRTTEQTDYYFEYSKIRINKEKTEITLK